MWTLYIGKQLGLHRLSLCPTGLQLLLMDLHLIGCRKNELAWQHALAAHNIYSRVRSNVHFSIYVLIKNVLICYDFTFSKQETCPMLTNAKTEPTSFFILD